MTNKKKPMGQIIVHSRPAKPITKGVAPLSKSRSEKELSLIAKRVAANGPLMQSLREVAGAEDEDRSREVVYEIIKYAQELDSTVTISEGPMIVDFSQNDWPLADEDGK